MSVKRLTMMDGYAWCVWVKPSPPPLHWPGLAWPGLAWHGMAQERSCALILRASDPRTSPDRTVAIAASVRNTPQIRPLADRPSSLSPLLLPLHSSPLHSISFHPILFQAARFFSSSRRFSSPCFLIWEGDGEKEDSWIGGFLDLCCVSWVKGWSREREFLFVYCRRNVWTSEWYVERVVDLGGRIFKVKFSCISMFFGMKRESGWKREVIWKIL